MKSDNAIIADSYRLRSNTTLLTLAKDLDERADAIEKNQESERERVGVKGLRAQAKRLRTMDDRIDTEMAMVGEWIADTAIYFGRDDK